MKRAAFDLEFLAFACEHLALTSSNNDQLRLGLSSLRFAMQCFTGCLFAPIIERCRADLECRHCGALASDMGPTDIAATSSPSACWSCGLEPNDPQKLGLHDEETLPLFS